jgi:signal transduction histidine kinase
MKGNISIDFSENNIKRSFNNAMVMIGLSSVWIFVYVVVVKGGGIDALRGMNGYIFIINMILLLLGLVISRNMLWSIVDSLLYFNKQTLKLEKELIEEHKVVTVAKTALSLSHGINNPLMILRGNIEILYNDIEEQGNDVQISDVKKRIFKMKEHCERIITVTNKLVNIAKPIETKVCKDVYMVDTGD